jgi:hypothetical protein
MGNHPIVRFASPTTPIKPMLPSIGTRIINNKLSFGGNRQQSHRCLTFDDMVIPTNKVSNNDVIVVMSKS